MFEKLKLGTKIAAGYAGVLLVSAFVTLFTFTRVSTESGQAMDLSQKLVPTVQLANELERATLAAMKEMKSYEYTRQDEFYRAASGYLDEVDATLARAQEHSHRYPELTGFGQSIDRTSSVIKEYRGLVAETKKNADALGAARDAMNTAAGRYMEAAEEYRRARQDTEIRDALLLLTEARLISWRAQALDNPKQMDDALARLATLDTDLARLRANRPEELQRLVDTMRAAGRDYAAQMRAVQASALESDQLGVKRGALARQATDAAKEVAVSGAQGVVNDTSDISTDLITLRNLVFTGFIVAVVLGVLLAIVVTRAITLPVNRIITGLSASGEQVASAASQVSSSSQQLANGASQQASNLEEVSSSLEEVTSMTRQNADNARKANGVAKQSADAATRGASGMERMNEAMQKIRSSATETAKIVKTIDQIAFQTNLLALNAAVEAARAGEAGKGFAVVAEEVRNLAQRSAEAAKTTASLLEEAQRNAESGAQMSEDVNGILKEILENVTQVSGLVAEVATASEQQTTGVGQINTAVSQMDRITQSNAANAEESASAAEELSAQAVELNQMVEHLGRLVNGAGATTVPGHAAPRKAHRAPAQAPRAPALAPARAPQAAAPAHASAPRPPPPPAGFQPLHSAPPVDPKELIPLDDSELKQF
ncbi:MAG: methyl-accepting chemotaxis protein [Myxococcota bacterium]